MPLLQTISDPMYRWEQLEYPIRIAWYHAKLAVGIEPISDKNFLPHDFAMRLRRGLLPADTRFTIAGRGDGVGMQAMARLSGLHFAHIYGATYVDTPFSIIDHVSNRGPGKSPVAAWESLFNFGRGEETILGQEDQIVDYADYLAGRAKWTPDSILRLQQCFWLYRRHTDSLERALPIFHKKYDWPLRDERRALSIDVHIRRGDVGKKKNSLRYTSNATVLRSVMQVEDVVRELGLAARVTIHSQGQPDDFPEFVERGYALNLDEDAIIAMRRFVESDIFVMSKSSFSYLAAIYNRGITLYEPTFNPALPSWIKRRPNGDFDRHSLFRALADRFLQSRPAPEFASPGFCALEQSVLRQLD